MLFIRHGAVLKISIDSMNDLNEDLQLTFLIHFKECLHSVLCTLLDWAMTTGNEAYISCFTCSTKPTAVFIVSIAGADFWGTSALEVTKNSWVSAWQSAPFSEVLKQEILFRFKMEKNFLAPWLELNLEVTEEINDFLL